jgi:hypothetical protein
VYNNEPVLLHSASTTSNTNPQVVAEKPSTRARDFARVKQASDALHRNNASARPCAMNTIGR